MHERTRRAIARMTFVFCCAVPTVITLSIILVSWTPWWHQRSLTAIESSLSRDTGLIVRIDNFRRSAPSTLYLYDVEFLEPETGREVARVREIQWAKRGDDVAIWLQQPELRSEQLPHAWSMIHDRFLCRPDQTSSSLKLMARDLTIHSRTGSLTLRDVLARMRPRVGEDAVEASIRCYPATSDQGATPSPVTISVLRDRSGSTPSTSWVLRTGDTPLPCSALAEYLPPLERLGGDAMFAGTMRWKLERDGWTIDLGGSQFTDIALGQWLEHLPHRLTGTASIQLQRCRIVTRQRATETVDIAGVLRAREGQIGPLMLKSARRHLGFAVVDASGAFEYDRIALGFSLNGPLLHLDGLCATDLGYQSLPEGVVVQVGGNPIAESTGSTLQATQLQAFFAPEHSVMVPLSKQTSPLKSLLMAPSRPTSNHDAAVPRITSTRQWNGGPSIEQP